MIEICGKVILCYEEERKTYIKVAYYDNYYETDAILNVQIEKGNIKDIKEKYENKEVLARFSLENKKWELVQIIR